MGVGVVADLVTFGDLAFEQRALGKRILADDEESRRRMIGLEDIEDARRPGRIRAIVKRQGQSDRGGRLGPLDGIGQRQPDEALIDDETVVVGSNRPLALDRRRANAKDFSPDPSMSTVVPAGTWVIAWGDCRPRLSLPKICQIGRIPP